MMHFDFETYLPEDILVKVDRMSMAHSIESRVPLLDNEVVDYAARLPADMKIRNGRRKHILKEAAAGLVPAQILDRRKQGFARASRRVVPRQSARAVFRCAALAARASARLLRAAIHRAARSRARAGPPRSRRSVCGRSSSSNCGTVSISIRVRSAAARV